MENTPVAITLSISEWTALLNTLSLAPFSAVNQIAAVVNSLQTQAAPVVEEAAKAAAEAAAAEAPAEAAAE